jgi:hypothetical protein
LLGVKLIHGEGNVFKSTGVVIKPNLNSYMELSKVCCRRPVSAAAAVADTAVSAAASGCDDGTVVFVINAFSFAHWTHLFPSHA